MSHQTFAPNPNAHISPQPTIAINSGQYTHFREPVDVPSPVATPMEWQSQSAQSAAGPSRRRVEQRDNSPREDDDGRIGVDEPFGERSYTEVKCLGDGSFGTVWLCDWHSPVRGGTLLSAMQCGAGARPEWAGKRLVALKRMKRVWEGGWKQARTLGELASLSRIPSHPYIIPLYDAFISAKSRELYFVFECMEGNLYQLTKSRRGRPLAAGLIASCFHQISAGLDHIHRHGYFHRDMKPENLLVTTTGLTDYLTAATLNAINALSAGSDEQHPPGVEMRYEKDVSVIVKLADFGLARSITSKPPYTEYVSTRWYRAPEVLLRSREYGAPVDMWALGTILAEMLNLKPLFPGASEIDQVYKICECLGDPSASHGQDERGRQIGGGPWNTGIKLAKNVGFSFPKRKPVDFKGLFNSTVPQSLIDCIADLLRYNPRFRMTAAQLMDHPYFHETLPHLRQTQPLPRIPFSQGQPTVAPRLAPEINVPPRQLPPSHAHGETRPAFANGDMRTLPPPVGTPDSTGGRVIFPSHSYESRAYSASALVNQLKELDLPTEDLASYGHRQQPSPRQTEGTSAYQSLSVSNLNLADRQRTAPSSHVAAYVQQQQQFETPSLPPPIEPTVGAAPVPVAGKKKKWGLSSVFGLSEKHLPPVQEAPYSSSLKRTQSGTPAGPVIDDPKKAKKEAERQARELERAKREAAVRAQQERARAVMRKREHIIEERTARQETTPLEETAQIFQAARPLAPSAMSVATRRAVIPTSSSLASIPSGESTHDLSSALQMEQSRASLSTHAQQLNAAALAGYEEASRHKARKRDGDDDHSVSSFDVNSLKSRSVLTVGTVDSDPGPRRGDPLIEAQARRHAHIKTNRSASKSRLMSGSNPSLESQLANDFRIRANLASSSASSLGRHGTSSMNLHESSASPPAPQGYPFASTLDPRVYAPGGQGSAPTSPYGHPQGKAVALGHGVGRPHLEPRYYGQGQSQERLPGVADMQEGMINPMFRVPPAQNPQQTTLPPFSAIASVADKSRSDLRR